MLTKPYTAIRGTPNWWPRKPVAAILDYSLNICDAIDPTNDFISAATAACAPSGASELSISNLIVDGDFLTLTEAGGQPGRIYTIMFLVTCSNGRVFEFFVYQGIPPGLPGYSVPVSPLPGFGTAISTDIGTLINNGGVVNSTYAGFPITDFDLCPGAVWSNGGELQVVPGCILSTWETLLIPFSLMTTVGLLALGGGRFPIVDPQIVGILWVNGNVLEISQG